MNQIEIGNKNRGVEMGTVNLSFRFFGGFWNFGQISI